MKLAMSRSRKVFIGLAAVIVLASIPASAVLTRSPGRLVATSGHPRTTALATASKSAAPLVSASAAPSATVAASVQATSSTAERNAAAAVAAAAPATPATALLSIPRIGIKNAPIYDRSTNSKGVMLIAPGYAVTHYSFSAAYGTGNTVLYGHDDIQGNIFGHLYDLAAGDLVQVTAGGQTLTYRVSGHQIVTPTTVSVLAPTGDIRLTIITCWPFDVDTKRWIVTALKA